MSLRGAHGRAAELGQLVVIETPPVDELQPGPGAVATGPVERRQDGSLTSAGARELGRRGGRASAQSRRVAARLARQLGLAKVPEALKPYVGLAKEFAAAQLRQLTDSFGELGPGPSSMIQSAALALASSRAAYAEGRDKDGAKLAHESKQALLTAWHLAELEQKSRPQMDPIEALRRQASLRAANRNGDG